MSRKALIITNLLIIATLILGLMVWYQTALRAHSKNTEPVNLMIASGTKTTTIIDDLKEEELIRSRLAVKIYLYLHSDVKLQAGSYQFVPNISTRQILSILTRGETANQEITLLFREGLTSREMQAELTKQGYLTDGSFLTLATTPIKNLPSSLQEFSFLDSVSSSATLEGYLFPDTYRLYRDFTAEDLVAKMLTNFERKLTPDLRQAIGRSGRNLEEIITMASVVEKEVQTEKDMKVVAGIFWNRIKIGQALQSCASLAYILGVHKVQYSYEDTQVKSPYNTYLHPGLPPGPISNPGLQAITAALNPTDSDYNYFLSKPESGESVFSRTLEEHNQAKARFLE